MRSSSLCSAACFTSPQRTRGASRSCGPMQARPLAPPVSSPGCYLPCPRPPCSPRASDQCCRPTTERAPGRPGRKEATSTARESTGPKYMHAYVRVYTYTYYMSIRNSIGIRMAHLCATLCFSQAMKGKMDIIFCELIKKGYNCNSQNSYKSL
jgi:hypothetical protein